MARPKYDVFISHASEDKAAFAEPLALALRKWGLNVWFDKFSLRVGDSLRDSIEMGLANSRYGVVVFSPSFLVKNWPKAELNGLFARQMQGKRRVILPIWHEISANEMIKAIPIQADSIALKSSDGVESVARSLVEVIRPSLLKLEQKRGLAFEATESFINVAKAQFPGYDFTLRSGAVDSPIDAGIMGTGRHSGHRIDIRVSNPGLISEPPKMKFEFNGEGAAKFLELYRTGKPQSWKPGEFKYLSGTVPLIPPILAGGSMASGPGSFGGELRHVRLEIGDLEPVVFPIMEMRPVRAGVEEVEAKVGYKNTPFSLSLVISLVPARSIEISFSTILTGHTFSQCERTIRAIDRLLIGEPLRLVDIESNKTLTEGPCNLEQQMEKPFSPDLRSLVSLGAQIEERFVTSFLLPERLMEDDSKTLAILDCLLNGHEYGTGLNTTTTVIKAEGELGAAQRPLLVGNPVVSFLEPTDYPGYFNLFGKKIAAPPWGLYTEKLVSSGSDKILAEFDQAPVGAEFEVELHAQTPSFVRWSHSL
jgi:hypothetical protein